MDSLDLGSILPGIGFAGIIDALARMIFAMLRISAFLVVSPLFGTRFVPVVVRIVASVVMALPVATLPGLPDGQTLASLSALPMIAGELAVGIVAGLVLTILFGAASVAGDRIASTAGLGFAAQFDPTASGQTPVVSQIFGFFLLMVFLAHDGHLVAIRIVLDSYSIAPAGQLPDPTALIAAGVLAGGEMFALSLSIMLPVVAVLLLVNLAIGVITRSAPQLNLFSFGFPITMTVTIVLLYITAPLTGSVLARVAQAGLDAVSAVFAGGLVHG
jgi:flagellar biosynthetic protein FliR